MKHPAHFLLLSLVAIGLGAGALPAQSEELPGSEAASAAAAAFDENVALKQDATVQTVAAPEDDFGAEYDFDFAAFANAQKRGGNASRGGQTTTYGNRNYYSNGGQSTTYGNREYFSNGGQATTYGNREYFSNGGQTTTYGNRQYYSNGGQATTYGNRTYFSNGGQCTTYGNRQYC